MVLAVGIGLAGLLAGIFFLLRYQAEKNEELQMRQLQQALQAADAITSNDAAIAAYENLKSTRPEIQIRILQRQWPQALAILRQIQLARMRNLQNEVPRYTDQLRKHLEAMSDRSSSILTDSDSLPAEILWRAKNIEGAVKLLTAFLMLEDIANVDKAQGVVREAVSDFKAAIEAVEKTENPAFEKNIPRWNLEMLIGQEYVKRIEAARTDPERNQALKENLETLIPEIGGYAPGEPIETRIQK